MAAYFDQNGQLLDYRSASEVDANGSWLAVRGSAGDLSGLYDGSYTVVISNVASNGDWTPVGAAPMDVTGNPPPPADGCYPGEQATCEASGDFWHSPTCSCCGDNYCGPGEAQVCYLDCA